MSSYLPTITWDTPASAQVQATQKSIDNLTTVTTEGFAGVGRGQNELKEGQNDLSSKVQKMIQTKKEQDEQLNGKNAEIADLKSQLALAQLYNNGYATMILSTQKAVQKKDGAQPAAIAIPFGRLTIDPPVGLAVGLASPCHAPVASPNRMGASELQLGIQNSVARRRGAAPRTPLASPNRSMASELQLAIRNSSARRQAASQAASESLDDVLAAGLESIKKGSAGEESSSSDESNSSFDSDFSSPTTKK
jgi:hypothetical protein